MTRSAAKKLSAWKQKPPANSSPQAKAISECVGPLLLECQLECQCTKDKRRRVEDVKNNPICMNPTAFRWSSEKASGQSESQTDQCHPFASSPPWCLVARSISGYMRNAPVFSLIFSDPSQDPENGLITHSSRAMSCVVRRSHGSVRKEIGIQA